MKIEKETILAATQSAMKTVASTLGLELADNIADDTLLLESGLDSLGFAMLVALLEEELGYDPFARSEVAVYPVKFAEFIEFYFDHQPKQ